jgi:subtilisin family serine protease
VIFAVLILALIALGAFARGARSLLAQEATPEAIPEAGDEVQVSPYLTAELVAGAEEVSILVLLKDQPDVAALQAAAAGAGNSVATSVESRRIARTTAIYQALTAHALQSQADLRAWLDAHNVPYRAHYIINMISVTGNAELVEALRRRPDVARLDANPQVDTMHITAAAEGAASLNSWARILLLPDAAASLNTPYGVAATRAPEVWALGYRGQGIVVASQDTGVQWDHPALLPHYRGAISETVVHTYHWLDAIPENGGFDGCAGLDEPCDDNGHGTHTVGTMVGSSDVITYGVAPDALWMGCRNMRSGVGTPESYTTCFEFFLAPYPPGGDPLTDGRPELAPHIINNSWGCPPSEGCNKDSLRQVVETVRAAGLMVVASAGNNGSGCSGVVDPIAIYDATFSVGAHDANGNLGAFSSKGPVTADGSGRLKPDITAPGVNILSTYRFGGTTSLSGTSMASPHVAGAVALLWSAVPWLVADIDLTEQVLLKSAIPVFSTLCGEVDVAASPNPAFGYGRLDVAAAVELAMQPWELTVVVTDSVGAPVVGAQVTWIDARTGYTTTAATGVDGNVIISPTLAGAYTLQVEAEAGMVEIANIMLVNEGTATSPQTVRYDILYDQAVVPYPSRHYLPGIHFAQP